jgi:putative addiction module component (TIGR02574 family)
MEISKADILSLSVAERIQLVEETWDSIHEDSQAVEISDELRAELDRRVEEHQRDPASAVSWDEIEARIRNRT